MALPSFSHHLRRYRRSVGLTQKELAWLLGSPDRTTISHYEGLRRQPSVADLLACEFIFGASARDLWPALFRQAVQATALRASALLEDMQSNPPKTRGAHKLALLEGLAAAAKHDQDEQQNRFAAPAARR